MPGMEDANKAMTNRSLRTIRTELEFLADSSVITQQQLSSILTQLPSQSSLYAPLLSNSNTPVPQSPPVAQLAATSLNEKQSSYYAPTPSPAPPPPAYASAPSIATASALYAYNPSDAGDLAILPNDRISIMEYMNADWAKGHNERTGQEGIFPRSYVNIVDEKTVVGPAQPPPPPTPGSGYGNMPLEVSQTGGGRLGGGHHMGTGNSKFDENGKKFGKKLGNAAIFGAGASIGGKIVNGIF
ncbi:hypothetical protein MMC20_000671 [Loxospora ochrophaea]|nr:hypothetical protein [Loxospora ochrophaea]